MSVHKISEAYLRTKAFRHIMILFTNLSGSYFEKFKNGVTHMSDDTEYNMYQYTCMRKPA